MVITQDLERIVLVDAEERSGLSAEGPPVRSSAISLIPTGSASSATKSCATSWRSSALIRIPKKY